MNNIKKTLILVSILLIVLVCFSCTSTSNKSNEIYWWFDLSLNTDWRWIDEGEYSHGDIINNEYTETFNALLEEKGFDYKVNFGVLDPSLFALENTNKKTEHDAIKDIIDKGYEVDIIGSTGNNYEDYLPLDGYIKDNDDFKLFYDSLPRSFWKCGEINHELLTIPNINISYAYKNAAVVDEELAKKYNVSSDDFKDLESITSLLKEVYESENRNVLPIAYMELQAMNLLDEELVRVIPEYTSNLVIYQNDNKWIIDDISQTPYFKEYVKWVEDLNRNNLTGIDLSLNEYQSMYNNNLFMNFSQYRQPIVADLYHPDKEQFPIGNYYISGNGGSAIYKDSSNKDKCLELLTLINTDQELSELFIYGIENKDYEIKDGLVYPLDNKYIATIQSPRSLYGNYLIVTPSYLMGENAKDEILDYMNSIDSSEVQSFYPVIDEEMESLINELYGFGKDDLVFVFTLKEGTDEYLAQRYNTLKDEGLNLLISELQDQLNDYLNDYLNE